MSRCCLVTRRPQRRRPEARRGDCAGARGGERSKCAVGGVPRLSAPIGRASKGSGVGVACTGTGVSSCSCRSLHASSRVRRKMCAASCWAAVVYCLRAGQNMCLASPEPPALPRHLQWAQCALSPGPNGFLPCRKSIRQCFASRHRLFAATRSSCRPLVASHRHRTRRAAEPQRRRARPSCRSVRRRLRASLSCATRLMASRNMLLTCGLS